MTDTTSPAAQRPDPDVTSTDATSPDVGAFDPRPLLHAVFDQTGTLLAAIRPDQAQAPTPCPEWDVAGLVEHVQAVALRIAAVLDGRPFSSVPRQLPSTDWTADWAAGCAEAEDVLADDTTLTRMVTVPWGEVPGASAAASYIGELAVHGWDLARATGLESLLNDELASAALPAYQAKVPAEPRGGNIPFGPVVQVGPDATPYERLVAWTGRDPGWTA